MSLLAYNFRKTVAKDKDYRMRDEAKCEVGYPTGFLNFDFTNGSVIHVKSEEKNLDYNYFSVGIIDGSASTFVGRPGCGKTTFVAQIAANIVRPFKTSCIFEDSVEGGLTWSRREALSGFQDKELVNRYIVRHAGVNAENFYKRIKMIHDMKIAEPEKYTYDTGLLDNFGNPLHKLEPTVYILDSIAMLMPELQADADELVGNMAGPQGARVITQIFRTIIPMLKTANIILLCINHILEDPGAEMNKKKASLAYLKQNETMPKGKTVIFLSNNIVRLDDAKKLQDDEKFKFQGSIVTATFCKSRTNGNKTTKLIFSQEKGFDPVLSLFWFLYEEKKRISGAGVGMYLDIDPEKKYKFSMGNIKDKLEKNPEFSQNFMQVAQEELCKLPKLYLKDAEKENAISNGILAMCMNIRPKTEEVLAQEDIEDVLYDKDQEESDYNDEY